MNSGFSTKFLSMSLTPVLLFITVFLLAFSEAITRNIMESRQNQYILEEIQNIFPEASFYLYEENTDIYIVYDVKRNKIGYSFYARGRGESVFGGEIGEKLPGPIVILIGLEDKETIKGIFVISHSETPGFWNSLIKENYFDQFSGLKIANAYFREDGGQVDAITYATLSSALVLNTVREAALEKSHHIR